MYSSFTWNFNPYLLFHNIHQNFLIYSSFCFTSRQFFLHWIIKLSQPLRSSVKFMKILFHSISFLSFFCSNTQFVHQSFFIVSLLSREYFYQDFILPLGSHKLFVILWILWESIADTFYIYNEKTALNKRETEKQQRMVVLNQRQST